MSAQPPAPSPRANVGVGGSGSPQHPVRGALVTPRAILLGAVLVPFNAAWVIRLERVMFGPYPSTISLFPNAIFELFLLVGANAMVRRRFPARAFSQAELITVYFMVTIATGIAGLDGAPILNQLMAHGVWFGTSAGKWGSFLGSFPRWLVVTDLDAVRGHFLGSSTLYRMEHLRAWAVPVLAWTFFLIALIWTSMCVNVLLRKQWQDRERLTFPVVWLPLEMCEARGALWSSPLMWAGFALAALSGMYNGIAFLNPSLPMLPIGTYDLRPFLTVKPWNAIVWLPTTLYPVAIGMSYLLPLDLLFSCWFFFIFWNAQVVVSSQFGWDITPDFPFVREQAFGAVMGLAGFYILSARRSLAEAWRAAWRPARGGDGDGEALSYRAAFVGIAGGVAALGGFCLLAGMSPLLIAAYFTLFFGIVLVVTRIRAELGPPAHDFHFIGPDRMLPRALGVATWRQRDLTMLAMFFCLNRAHRADTQPAGIEALYAAHKRGWNPGGIFRAVMIAVALGVLSSFWSHEHQAYTYGAAAKFGQGTWQGNEAFERLSGMIEGTLDARSNTRAVIAMFIGLCTCLAMMAVRLRFVGFPLHPIGYAIASGWSINLFWLPMIIAWVIKLAAMRYGGLAMYRRLMPFFLGLILGDCVQGAVWGLVSLTLNMRTYNFFGM